MMIADGAGEMVLSDKCQTAAHGRNKETASAEQTQSNSSSFREASDLRLSFVGLHWRDLELSRGAFDLCQSSVPMI